MDTRIRVESRRYLRRDTSFKHVTLRIEDRVASVILNRPPVNAFNREFVAELTQLARSLKNDKTVWLVSVTSSGSVFSAGADLKERAALPASRVAMTVRNIQRMVLSWVQLPQPVVMGIRGAALGGGLEFALAADLLVAAENASLGFPEVTLGIIPAAGGTQLLPLRTSLAVARKWILGGQRHTAHEAFDDGVVDLIFPSNGFEDQYARVIASFAVNAPLAMRQAKKALSTHPLKTLRDGLRIEGACYASLIKTRDRHEALEAFLEKRQPVWKGK
jgi:enoyl-CoA hydratase/carnithine racemase